MNGLSIAAILLAIVTSVFTWVDFSDTEIVQEDSQGALLNKNADEEIKVEDILSLRVAKWDDAIKEASRFAVAYQDGDWIIPSHFNYPADEGKRVGQTAAHVMNIKRGPLVSEDPQEHAELGVLDPLDDAERSADQSGFGQRVTLEGKGGKVLLDLIIGNSSQTANVRYVRQAKENRVYTAPINLTASTSFKDWVETDLLKIESTSVRDIRIQDYSVNEQTQRIETRSETAFVRKDEVSDWTSKQQPKKKQIAKAAVDGLVTEATSIRLIDIQPFHQQLLTTKGFIVAQNGAIYGNEGAIMITTKDGLVYFLFFGEVAVDKDAETEEGQEAKADNRYLAVFVRYSEESDEEIGHLLNSKKLAAEEEAKKDMKKEDEPKEGTKAEEEKPKQEEPEKIDYDKKIAERKKAGNASAEEKQQRFSKFFYVIDNASFKKLRPAQETLFVDPPKEEKKDADQKKGKK